MKSLILKWPLLALVPFTLPLLKGNVGPAAFPQSMPVIRPAAPVQAPLAITPLYSLTTHITQR